MLFLFWLTRVFSRAILFLPLFASQSIGQFFLRLWNISFTSGRTELLSVKLNGNWNIKPDMIPDELIFDTNPPEIYSASNLFLLKRVAFVISTPKKWFKLIMKIYRNGNLEQLFFPETIFQLHVRSKVCMALLHMRIKVYNAPFHM